LNCIHDRCYYEALSKTGLLAMGTIAGATHA
jgi:hypothetical protein